MIRVLGSVLGHAKVLTCAGVIAGGCVAGPAAVHAWHGRHEGRTVAARLDEGGNRGAQRMQDGGHHGRLEATAWHGERRRG